MFGGLWFGLNYFAQPTDKAFYGTNTHSVTKSLQYNVKSTPSALTKSVKYTVKTTPTAKTKSLEYTVKTTRTAVTKSLKYTILNAGVITFGHGGGFGALYFGQNYFAQPDTSLVLGKNFKRLSLHYTVKRTQSALTKSLKYGVVVSRSLTKSLTYHVSPLLKKTLKYTIKITQTPLTKSLEYTVKHGLALQKSLTYEIKKAGFTDLYIPKNTQYATNNLYVKQSTTFTDLY